MTDTEYEVKCIGCGIDYIARINRNGYCPVCKAERAAQSRHRYYEKRKQNNKAIKAELIDCEICGKLFNAVLSDQKRCPACQLVHERDNKRQNTIDYRRKHFDCIQIKVPKGKREDIKQMAAVNGDSLQSLYTKGEKLYNAIYALSESDRDRVLEMLGIKL